MSDKEKEQSERPPFPADEYLEAIADERDCRDFAFLDLPHFICGIEVRAMTLRQVLARLAINCPFLLGDYDSAGAGDAAGFIWHISTEFVSPYRPFEFFRARKKFVQALAPIAFGEIKDGIRKYLENIFLDAPPSASSGSNKVPKSSIAATFIDIFATQYGWTIDRILDSQLPQLYQLIREIQQRTNPKAVFFNRKSDRVRARWLRQVNEGAKKKGKKR